MSIKEVTRYEASNGKEFKDKVQAIKYESALEATNHAIDTLPKVDIGCSEYVQLTLNQYNHFKQQFDNIIQAFYPELMKHIAGQHIRRSIIGRLLDDYDSPAYKLTSILDSIDDKLRWYNQPYYANHPIETVDFKRIGG